MDLDILPNLDEDGTCDNVTKFFKKDLEKLVLLSGHRMIDLQSPQIDGISGGSGNFNNSVENKLLNGLDAQNIVKSVDDAIHHGIDPTSKKIIIGLFINNQRWVDVQNVIFKEHTSFATLRRKALIAFSYSFEGWQRKNHCDQVIVLNEYR